MSAEAETFRIFVGADGIYLNAQRIEIEALAAKLREAASDVPRPRVHIERENSGEIEDKGALEGTLSAIEKAVQDSGLQKIASKAAVWHLIQRGMLMQLHFDKETFGLDRDFAQISAYGDALGDIAGNLVDSVEINVKRPSRRLPDPRALLVTHTEPQELDAPGRDPHRIAMGKIAERFERGPEAITRLPLVPREVTFETAVKHKKGHKKKMVTETVLEYPLLGDDGKVVNHARYHPEGKRISYRIEDDPASPYREEINNDFYTDADGSKWRFKKPRLKVGGYRIKRADIIWMRSNLLAAGYHPSNLFFAYSRATITNKQHEKNYAVDTYDLVMAAHVFGRQDEEKLQLGTRRDRSGEIVPSAKLGLVMRANTRYANPQRGIGEGVFMPDRSIHAEPKAHRSPAYDAQASFALDSYIRAQDPDISRAVEEQSDEKELRRILPGEGSDTVPVFAMSSNVYPLTPPLAHPVMGLGFDDQEGNLNKGIVIRLDIDLDNFKYRGKKLDEMSAKEISVMIKEQYRKPDCLIRVESVRRWPGAIPLENALGATGAGVQWDYMQMDANIHYLVSRPGLCQSIRKATGILNREASHRPDPPNAMMEEQGVRNGFGDLDYLETLAGEKKGHGHGAVRGIFQTLHAKATDVYNNQKKTDALLHSLALAPHPIEWRNDEDALGSFHDLLKRTRTKLNDENSPYRFILNSDPWVRRFLENYDPKHENNMRFAEEARAWRWKLMRRFLEDDTAQRALAPESTYSKGYFDYDCMKDRRILFANPSRDYRIVDHGGRELDLDYIRDQHARDPHLVIKKIEKGEWRFQFYRLSSRASLAADLFQFDDMGKLNDLPARWQKENEALRGAYLHGPPGTPPEQHRWSDFERNDRVIEQIEINAKLGNQAELARIFNEYAPGEGDAYAWSDESQRILARIKIFQQEEKEKYPLRDDFRRAANFDPESGMVYDWVKYEIDSRNVVIIDVPDIHLRHPLDDVRVSSPYSLVVPKIDAEDKKKIREGASVILRGAQTGRWHYAGPVETVKAPRADEGFRDYYTLAENAYKDSGMDFPPASERDVILIAAPKLVAQTRRDIDASIQSVKVPSLYHDALVCPLLSHMPKDEPLTGLILPVDFCPQTLEPGKPIRFREINAPLSAKLDGVVKKDTGNIYESTLNDVRRMKVGDIRQNIDEETARACGFASTLGMWETVMEAFLKQESPDPANEEVFVLAFDKVKKKSWALFDPLHAPEAALIYGGKPPPPSAYRPDAPKKAA